MPNTEELMELAAERFDRWIDELTEEVIQGEYGYEPGEFTVYPDQWRPLYDEGLTPEQAFRRALDAFADERQRRDREKAELWARIQAADAAFLRALAQGESRK